VIDTQLISNPLYHADDTKMIIYLSEPMEIQQFVLRNKNQKPNTPLRFYDTLFVPLRDNVLLNLLPGLTIELQLTEQIRKIFFNKHSALTPFEILICYCDDKIRCFKIKNGIKLDIQHNKFINIEIFPTLKHNSMGIWGKLRIYCEKVCYFSIIFFKFAHNDIRLSKS